MALPLRERLTIRNEGAITDDGDILVGDEVVQRLGCIAILDVVKDESVVATAQLCPGDDFTAYYTQGDGRFGEGRFGIKQNDQGEVLYIRVPTTNTTPRAPLIVDEPLPTEGLRLKMTMMSPPSEDDDWAKVPLSKFQFPLVDVVVRPGAPASEEA